MTEQRLATTQARVNVAARTSMTAWTLTGQRFRYLLAEARPMPQQQGDVRFEGMLFRDRARKAREFAAAWHAAAEAWDEAARSVSTDPERSNAHRP